nr:bifunctional protein FolD 2-like [Nicotiana tomentosiformis]
MRNSSIQVFCYFQVPGLAVVIVGNRKDSQSYVNMKRKSCAELGIQSFDIDLPEDVAEDELISKVHELNANRDVHGILVQLPLPKHVNEERVLGEISLEKDVDGFHPLNIGKLAMKGRQPLFLPCTPKGCIELLHRSGISIKGKNAVVVGRSNIVGLPVSPLLLKEDATVTIVHSRTKEPEKIVREADIIIAAAGQAMMIKGSWIKPGAAVIDVGINAVDDPTRKSQKRRMDPVEDPIIEEQVKVPVAEPAPVTQAGLFPADPTTSHAGGGAQTPTAQAPGYEATVYKTPSTLPVGGAQLVASAIPEPRPTMAEVEMGTPYGPVMEIARRIEGVGQRGQEQMPREKRF